MKTHFYAISRLNTCLNFVDTKKHYNKYYVIKKNIEKNKLASL